jgi:hypothetical protein
MAWPDLKELRKAAAARGSRLLVVCLLLLEILREVFEHRLLTWVNEQLDKGAGPMIRRLSIVLTWISDNRVLFVLLLAVLYCLIVIIVAQYKSARRSSSEVRSLRPSVISGRGLSEAKALDPNRPVIRLEFTNAKLSKVGLEEYGFIVLHNVGEHAASSVQIERLERGEWRIEFKHINFIDRHSNAIPHHVTYLKGGFFAASDHSSPAHGLRNFLNNNSDITDERVPLTITYTDTDGTQLCTRQVIHYEPMIEEVSYVSTEECPPQLAPGIGSQSGVVAPVTERPVRRPHFRFTGLGYKALFINPSPREGIGEPTTDEQETESVMGVTLSFTNMAVDDGSSKRAINVVARIRFYSDNWSKSRDILYGVWLNSPCNSTEMEIGAVEELLLILVNGSDYCALRDLRVDINKQYQNYFTLEDVAWVSHVRVKLTDQISATSEVFSLRVWYDGKGWCHHSVTPPEPVERVPW